jgi:hypothetical protein
MDILALDLGDTTGFAYFRKGKVWQYGSFLTEDTDAQYLEFRTLGRPVHVVVEKPIVIKGPLGDRMAGLIARTEAEFGGSIYYVTAAQWKPHPVIKKLRRDLKGRSPHEKDAICIGAWYLIVHLQVEA